MFFYEVSYANKIISVLNSPQMSKMAIFSIFDPKFGCKPSKFLLMQNQIFNYSIMTKYVQFHKDWTKIIDFIAISKIFKLNNMIKSGRGHYDVMHPLKNWAPFRILFLKLWINQKS